MTTRRGFSLMEIVIVLALASMILFAVALLTQRTLGSMKYLQRKSISTQAATLGCERMASELRESVQMVNLSPSVSFRKINPSSPPAAGNPMAQDPPPALVPVGPAPPLWARVYPPSENALVEYRKDSSNPLNTTLVRSVNGGSTMTVASYVNDFTVIAEPDTERTHRVTLSIVEDKRVRIFTSVVYSPGLPE